MMNIVPGTCETAGRDRDPREWIFIDMGFSSKSRSCGIAVGDGDPESVRFHALVPRAVEELKKHSAPVNLLIEAPLSVAFNSAGNPTGRRIEKRGSQTRYWYVGAGAATLLAATHFLYRLRSGNPPNGIRLFEGFASFKPKGKGSSHEEDVRILRDIALGQGGRGSWVGKEALKICPGDCLQPAFRVSGMDFGVPAVAVVGE